MDLGPYPTYFAYFALSTAPLRQWHVPSISLLRCGSSLLPVHPPTQVCNNFRPVMHYFFLEKFREPSEWYLRRLTYTRSVAANSMV